MATITTLAFANQAAIQFLDLISNGEYNVYFFIGRQLPWVNEPLPDTPVDTVNSFKTLWDNMWAAQLVTPNNGSLVVPRINWTSNTVYTAYTDTNGSLFTSPYYILTSALECYKCLSNNNGQPSTVQPSGLGTSGNNYIQTTSDGYVWKYMLDVADNDQFINDFYFATPAIPPTSSYQQIVADAATPGSIDFIQLNAGGAGYSNGGNVNIITITGDGSGAFYTANISGGSVVGLNPVSYGSGYSYATVTFADILTDQGYINGGANATAIMSPPGGNGSDAALELGSNTVMVLSTLDGTEDGYFSTNNSFRQCGLIFNIDDYGSNTYAANALVNTCTTIVVTSGVGTYVASEQVYQGTSPSTSTFSGYVIDFNSVINTLRLNNITGTFATDQILYGVTSGAQRYTINIINPDVQKYTGTLLALDNISPITRSATQNETYKFILPF